MPRESTVQSVQRVFGLLETLAGAGGQLSLSELAAASGLPLPTIHRLINTLVAGGYVRQQSSRRYSLGPRLIHLGKVATGMLAEWAEPRLAELVEQIGETANLSMLDGDCVTYVAQVPSRYSMRMFTEVGRRMGLHCTGAGKALLAQLGEADLQAVIRRAGLAPQTPQTITDPAQLRTELQRIRDRGYSIDDGEQELGVRCVAVAVPTVANPFALSVSGPTARMTPETVERAASLLRAAAAALAADVGR